MPIIITLYLGKEQYNILQCRYVFSRDIDSKSLPRGGMKGGDIYVTMESTRNTLLFEEFVRKDGPRPVSGSIDFYDTREGKCIRTIEFEEAYIYALGEHMARHSHLPMTQAIAISPLRMDINGTVRMDRRFPQTYAFWWEEYKPEVQAIPVKTWDGSYTISDAYWYDEEGNQNRNFDVEAPVTLYVIFGKYNAGNTVKLIFEDEETGKFKKFEYSGNVDGDGILIIEDFKLEPKEEKEE